MHMYSFVIIVYRLLLFVILFMSYSLIINVEDIEVEIRFGIPHECAVIKMYDMTAL